MSRKRVKDGKMIKTKIKKRKTKEQEYEEN